MPRGMLKSRRLRRVFVKAPGGNTKLQYKERKPSKAVCAHCKKVLAGVPYATSAEMRNMPKTAKRPQRPYGGVLCSTCMRKVLQEKARSEK